MKNNVQIEEKHRHGFALQKASTVYKASGSLGRKNRSWNILKPTCQLQRASIQAQNALPPLGRSVLSKYARNP